MGNSVVFVKKKERDKLIFLGNSEAKGLNVWQQEQIWSWQQKLVERILVVAGARLLLETKHLAKVLHNWATESCTVVMAPYCLHVSPRLLSPLSECFPISQFFLYTFCLSVCSEYILPLGRLAFFVIWWTPAIGSVFKQ